jgi:ribosome-associated heat shock protein Hsp15
MAREVGQSKREQHDVASQRLDKWLWFARVAKTRTLAAGLISNGRVRVNRVRVTKPAHIVRIEDVITVSVPGGVRVLKVVLGGLRRGPATEAATLYDEIVPLQSTRRVSTRLSDDPDGAVAEVSVDSGPGAGHGGPVSEAGSGRPTKKDRRVLDRLRARNDD